MNRFVQFFALVGVLSCGLFAGIAAHAHDGAKGLGGALSAVTFGYLRDQQTAAFLSNQSVASAADLAVLVSGTITNGTVTGAFRVEGRPTLNVSARFAKASETCTIRIARYSLDGTTFNFLGLSAPITLTATSYTSGGHYVATDVPFDTGGASHVAIVMVTGPTAQGVYLWLGSS